MVMTAGEAEVTRAQGMGFWSLDSAGDGDSRES